jgi:hypothetical protein
MPTDHSTVARKDRKGVFISYARSDGEEFATQLRLKLEREQPNIKLWQDRAQMLGGDDWWLQIERALNEVEFMVMVMTPAALASDIVRREWRYARQQGVCVYPVKAHPALDFASLPRWMRSCHFYDIGDIGNDFGGPEWLRFANDLNTRCQTRRVPMMAEPPPEDFVARPREFDQLINHLLDDKREEPVAITAALRGAGGYGKTTLAKALCHDERIQNAFDDGILWVTLGETPGDLTRRVEDLIYTLSGDRPGFTGVDAAVTRLVELIAEREILVVIDDVWDNAHLRPFTQGGPRCARLITTRNKGTLPDKTFKVDVDAMQPAEAVDLLGKGLLDGDGDESAAEKERLKSLAARLGEWALMLKLVNGTLRHRVNECHESLAEALRYADEALVECGLTFFSADNLELRHRTAEAALGVSFRQLKGDELARFQELAVFPEDTDIPLETLVKFWELTGGLNKFRAQNLCERLFKLSLLWDFDLAKKTVRLHDVIWKFLIEQNRDRLSGMHNQLLDAHLPVSTSPRPLASPWSDLPDDDPYLWNQLAYHLIEAGRGDELVATVKDWRYLAKKTLLRKSLSVEKDLLSAEKIAPADDPLRTLRRNYVNSGHLFNHCETPSDIEATLSARLSHLDDLKTILQDLANSLSSLRVAPQFTLPDLPHPALIRTLEGHSSLVKCCDFSPDWKLIVSASSDRTLRIWDAQSGEMRRMLEGHSGGVNGCAFSPDGKLIVSASDDNTQIHSEMQSRTRLR